MHETLRDEGIRAQVVNVPTLKPLASGEITRHGALTQCALTIEDHNIIGGLGSAIAEIYAEHLTKPVRRLGIPDVFTESDEGEVLRAAYGINGERAVAHVRAMLERA